MKSLLKWLTTLLEIGPEFGLFPIPVRSWLTRKFEIYALGEKLFTNTKVKITISGKSYLGSVLGKVTFKKQ